MPESLIEDEGSETSSRWPRRPAQNQVWSDDDNRWMRMRCDSTGHLMVTTKDAGQPQVLDASNVVQTIFDGAGVLEGVTNATDDLIQIFDDDELVGLVLPLGGLFTPIMIAVSCKVKSVGAIMNGQIATVHRLLT